MSPININLIIPFNNNKQLREQKLVLENHLSNLEDFASELSSDLKICFNDSAPFYLSARSQFGRAKKYYFRLNDKKKKYCDFADVEIQELLANEHYDLQLQIKCIANNVKILNSNLKAAFTLLQIIDEHIDEEILELIDVDE